MLRALRESPYCGPLMLELSGGHQGRDLLRQFGYDTSAEQEIVWSRAWLKWNWDELDYEALHGKNA